MKLFSTRLNKRLFLGRKQSDPTRKRLFLQNYLMSRASMPAPPAATTRSAGITFPMMLNDQLGDCVEAMKGHGIQMWTDFITGSMQTPTDQQVLVCYERNGGYNGTPITDNGEDMSESLDDLCKNGMAGLVAVARASINYQDHSELSLASYLFAAVPLAVNLPSNIMQVFDAKQPFTDTTEPPNRSMGHAILIADYNATGPIVITWATPVQASWAWVSKYGVEADAVLWSKTSAIKDVPGLDLTSWLADYSTLTGGAVIPPAPPAPPSPVDPPPPSPLPTQQQWDQVLTNLINLVVNPIARSWLMWVKAFGDWAFAHGQISARPSHFSIPPVPASVIAIIDAAFVAAETAYPEEAAVIGLVKTLVDQYMPRQSGPFRPGPFRPPWAPPYNPYYPPPYNPYAPPSPGW